MTTIEAAPSTSTAIPGYTTGRWKIDPVHSLVRFTVRHMMVSKVRGRFAKFAGEFTTAEDPRDSTVSVSIDLTSIDTGNAERDEHLRSADFFDVAANPTMTFVSTGVREDEDGLVLDGDLTIRGITRSVALRLEIGGFGPDAWGGVRAGFSASGQINRSDFGINFNTVMETGGVVIADRVDLLIEVQGIKRREFSGGLSVVADAPGTQVLGDALYSVDGAIARITMNRPTKVNALSDPLFHGILDALDLAENDPNVRVVILQGAGASFCSGYDLSGSDYSTTPEGGYTLTNALHKVRKMEEKYYRIWNFPKPTIARVQGYALAGGCYLQLLCDIAVAADDAEIGHPGMKLGGISSNPLWQVVMGVRAARYLLLTGRSVDGPTAERMGLVTLSTPGGDLDKVVDGIAADIASIPAESQLHHKESLNMALEIQGAGALFRYLGQMNAVSRIGRTVSRNPDGSWSFA